jgi:hypothetical protein
MPMQFMQLVINANCQRRGGRGAGGRRDMRHAAGLLFSVFRAVAPAPGPGRRRRSGTRARARARRVAIQPVCYVSGSEQRHCHGSGTRHQEWEVGSGNPPGSRQLQAANTAHTPPSPSTSLRYSTATRTPRWSSELGEAASGFGHGHTRTAGLAYFHSALAASRGTEGHRAYMTTH